MKIPMASVFIKSFGGQKVYVGGQVNSPGIVKIVGKTSVVQAIFEAGGLRADASMSDVLIISRGTDNRPAARKVNLKKVLKGKLSEEITLLKPYDMVYVSKSMIVKANEFIYHVYNFIPPNIWFGFSYELHREPRKSDYLQPRRSRRLREKLIQQTKGDHEDHEGTRRARRRHHEWHKAATMNFFFGITR